MLTKIFEQSDSDARKNAIGAMIVTVQWRDQIAQGVLLASEEMNND